MSTRIQAVSRLNCRLTTIIHRIDSHSRPMEVTATITYSVQCHEYSLCPNCLTPMDREYVNYCSFCGQKLAWNQYNIGKINMCTNKNS